MINEHNIERLGKYSKFYKEHHEKLGHEVIFSLKCLICKKRMSEKCGCWENIRKSVIAPSTVLIMYCFYCEDWGETKNDLEFKLWEVEKLRWKNKILELIIEYHELYNAIEKKKDGEKINGHLIGEAYRYACVKNHDSNPDIKSYMGEYIKQAKQMLESWNKVPEDDNNGQ